MAVKLAWVLVENREHHVSEFAGLLPAKRPCCVCPECASEVTLKLGLEVTHHAAHNPGSTCTLADSESALHFNAKMAVAAALRSSTLLQWGMKFGGTVYNGPCWDFVHVEYKVGSRVPDIVLSAKNLHVFALEIYVSSGVHAEKALDLAAQSLPWIEVEANTALDWVHLHNIGRRIPLIVRQSNLNLRAAYA